MIKNIIDMFKNGGMLEAFELSDSLPWSSESKTTYLTLRREYVSPPIGYQEENLRNRLILLLSENFGNSQNVEVLSYSIVSSLLGEDLVPQKRHFTSRQSKHNLVLLQGYPNCGLHYFILWKHHNKKCSFKPIKANFITNIDNEINFWDILVQSLNLPVDIKGTKKDIPTLIASKIEDQLKENSIIMIIYDIEFWGELCSGYLKKIANYFSRIPFGEDEENDFYCYFIHRDGGQLSDLHEKIIVLPPISELGETELENVYYNHKEIFRHCGNEIESLFSGRKKLSEVIDIFIKHSSHGEKISEYLNKILTI